MWKIALIIPAVLLLETLRILYTALNPKLGIDRTKAYSQHPENPSSHILCLGDSFGIGVGATDPSKSLIGNLGQDHPRTDITNLSQTRFTVAKMLDHVKKQDLNKYDAILFMVGGMDIISHTNPTKLRQSLEEVVQFLKPKTQELIMFVPIEAGSLPLYSFIEKGFLNHHARKVQQVFREVSAKNDCTTVYMDIKPSLADEKKYFFADRSHPNDLGYETLYNQIKPIFNRLK